MQWFKKEGGNPSGNQSPGRPFRYFYAWINTNLVEYVEFLLPVKFRRILLGSFRGEVKNWSASPVISFFRSVRKKKLGRRRWVLASGQIKADFVKRFQKKVKNISANQRPDGHLVFLIGPKYTNAVEDVKFLLPVKFWQILLTSDNSSI